MENNLVSEKAGTISSINVNKGDSVVEGDVLMVIDL
jgi:biotin carboxyl carrier protein